MSNEFVIDSISFARKSESLQGKIAVSNLKRVRDDLASSQGEIEFNLQGREDGRHRPSLVLSISGHVMLTCQRCLAEMPFALNVTRTLIMVPRESELPDLNAEDDEVDVIVMSGKLNVLEVLEDEVILALPLAPRHDFECVDRKVGDSEQSGAVRPFSILGKLG
jgi:uncharacterized protein